MNPGHEQALLGPDGCIAEALAQGEEIALRVTGSCMEPDLFDQASVRVRACRLFVPGDVVAFHCPSQNRLLMHRFLGYVRRRGAWKLMTMADNGVGPDPLVDLPHVLGSVVTQEGRDYRVAQAKRLQAVYRFVLWCARYYFRRRKNARPDR